LTGREFGQLRSEEAKQKMKGKLDEAEAEVGMQRERVKKMRQNVENAREKNESNYKTGKITKQEYESNRERINEAETITNQTEERVNSEMQNIEAARKEMEK
jgi:colicin import membrane protein